MHPKIASVIFWKTQSKSNRFQLNNDSKVQKSRPYCYKIFLRVVAALRRGQKVWEGTDRGTLPLLFFGRREVCHDTGQLRRHQEACCCQGYSTGISSFLCNPFCLNTLEFSSSLNWIFWEEKLCTGRLSKVCSELFGEAKKAQGLTEEPSINFPAQIKQALSTSIQPAKVPSFYHKIFPQQRFFFRIR